MILGISISILMICLLLKRSNIWGGILLLWLWVLFGWSSGNADYLNYIFKYEHINQLSGNFEVLYYKITEFANNIGLDYRQFLIVFAAIFVVVIFWFTRKNSDNWCFAIALYSIYPFMIDVVQVRNSMALIFIWIGLDKLINGKEKQEWFKYVICILIATLFHSGSLVFLFLVIPFFYTKKNVITIVTVSMIIGVVCKKFLNQFLIQIAYLLGMTSRFYQAANMDTKFELRKIVIIFSLFVTYQIGIFIIRSKRELFDRIDSKMLDLIEKINIMMLVVVPISEVLPDAYRMMSALALLNYTLWSKAMRTEKNRFLFSTNEGLLRAWGGVSAVFNIYLLILSSVNINTVFYPLIHDNMLLK